MKILPANHAKRRTSRPAQFPTVTENHFTSFATLRAIRGLYPFLHSVSSVYSVGKSAASPPFASFVGFVENHTVSAT